MEDLYQKEQVWCIFVPMATVLVQSMCFNYWLPKKSSSTLFCCTHLNTGYATLVLSMLSHFALWSTERPSIESRSTLVAVDNKFTACRKSCHLQRFCFKGQAHRYIDLNSVTIVIRLHLLCHLRVICRTQLWSLENLRTVCFTAVLHDFTQCSDSNSSSSVSFLDTTSC